MSFRAKLRSSTLLSAALLFTAPAGADITLDLVTRTDNQAGTETVRIAGPRLRLDATEGPDRNSMLFDADTKTLTMLDHQQKVYVEFTEESAAHMQETVKSMQKKMITQMQERMKAMSAEERQAMEQMMSELGTGMLPEGKPELRRVENTKQHQTVNGFDCNVVNVYAGQQKEQELCITSRDALGLSESEYRTFKALVGTLGKLGGDEASVLDELDGLPVRTVDYNEEGEQVTELKQVNKRAVLGPELFTIPAGYTRQEPFKLQ